MSRPTADILQVQHDKILRLQREIIRKYVVDQYNSGEVHKMPAMGQRSGFNVEPAEGWCMRHIYHAGDFDIFLFCGRASHQIPMHSSKSATTLHMRKGVIDVVREDHRAYQISAGDTLFIPADTRHHINAVEDTEVLVEFSPPVVHPHSVFPTLTENTTYADHQTHE